MTNDLGFNLYLITGGLDVKELIAACDKALKAGVSAIQVREKSLNAKELFDLCVEIRELTDRYNAKLFVNDRIDIALSVGADGAHLGVGGINIKDARKITPKDFIIGASTHSLKEAIGAEEGGADFITFGPVYSTPSKLAYGEPVGLEALGETCRKVKIPVFAIGGVKREKIKEIKEKGADGVAVISAVLGSNEPGKSAIELIEELNA